MDRTQYTTLMDVLKQVPDYRKRKGWEFPWYSSNGSRFNYDFHATIDESVAPLEINYRTRSDIERPEGASIAWAATADQPFEMPGISCFLRDGDDVFHTYSTFARGTEALGGAYAFLDLPFVEPELCLAQLTPAR
jgi:predicted dithiol-disulfide oxidoreductase (DUF899 family)